MLTKEQNDALTRTGPGTPGGNLLRRYWQPIALSTELPIGGAPVPIDIMGEELVLFRDQQGRVELADPHCWYPIVEKAGAFFAYLGPGAPPEFPNYDFLTLPDENIHVHKLFIDCNYMQANEGNYDPAHVGFLHRSFDPNRRPGLNFGALRLVDVTKDDIDLADVDPHEAPRLSVEETSFGIRIFQERSAGPGRKYLRVTYFCMPNFSVIAGPQGGDGQIGHYHVPITDETHWRWNFFVRRDAPLEAHHRMPNHLKKPGEYSDPYTITRKRSNRFMQDRATMDQNFTGMGPNFNTHDAFATETPGRIQDRTKEHLATTDVALAAARRQMLRAVEDVRAGRDPIGLVRNAAENRFDDMLSFDVVANESMPNADVVRRVVESHVTEMV